MIIIKNGAAYSEESRIAVKVSNFRNKFWLELFSELLESST